jgi:rhodanese-related sulfurtransferase
MNSTTSQVLAYPPASSSETASYMLHKLSFHADAWDVAEDLRHGIESIIVIDTRSEALYVKGHVPGAISFPHRLMDAQSTSAMDRNKLYVTYCDGIGCNGSTKGAYKLAALGFTVKEMLGGLDFWIRDGQPLVSGRAPGSMPNDAPAIECEC